MNDRGHPPIGGFHHEKARIEAKTELATAADAPLWFIAAFADGKETPDFLAGYEIDLRAALDRPRLADSLEALASPRALEVEGLI